MATIVSITYSPTELPAKPKDAYTRVPLQTATLVEHYGIEGDRKGGSPKRQLNVMSQENLRDLSENGFTIAPGQMGEQIIVEGLDLSTLATGERLQLGADAIIEITDRRNGCARFEHIQGRAPTEAKGLLGIMAKVITGGTIKVGDAAIVVQPQP